MGIQLEKDCLENPMDRGALQATVHRVAKESYTTQQLNNSSNELRTEKFYDHFLWNFLLPLFLIKVLWLLSLRSSFSFHIVTSFSKLYMFSFWEDFFLQVLNRTFDERSSCIAWYWKSKGRGINHRTDLRNTDPCSLLTRF